MPKLEIVLQRVHVPLDGDSDEPTNPTQWREQSNTPQRVCVRSTPKEPCHELILEKRLNSGEGIFFREALSDVLSVFMVFCFFSGPASLSSFHSASNNKKYRGGASLFMERACREGKRDINRTVVGKVPVLCG